MITWTLVLVFAGSGGTSTPIATVTIPGFGTQQACLAQADAQSKPNWSSIARVIETRYIEVGGPKL